MIGVAALKHAKEHGRITTIQREAIQLLYRYELGKPQS